MADSQVVAQWLRYHCVTSTTRAGSGHLTSSLSAADVMAVLINENFFHYDIQHPRYIHNDRLIFSKGHASPLFYAVWAAVGGIEVEELETLRKFGSRLEGHPTKEFPFTEVPTGALGQGLSVGFGMALNAKYLDKSSCKTYVLLGDSELSEGSIWEAFGEASYYQLNNLVAIVDMNRLGQRGETMLGRQSAVLAERIKSFGWDTYVIDGHNFSEITAALLQTKKTTKPIAIIANTIKGKGVSFLENKDGWHGKVLSVEQQKVACAEIGEVKPNLRVWLNVSGEVLGNGKEENIVDDQENCELRIANCEFDIGSLFSTRKAYGLSLAALMSTDARIVVLDAEVSNSTFSEEAKKKFPKRFFEMFIAEQHMVSTAVGLAERGKVPFISTFAAFFSRAADQIRMAGLGKANVKFIGSHAGVSIGEDGSSQMGLEDIALFRSMYGSTVLYPSDAKTMQKLVELASTVTGPVYIRATRKDTKVIYGSKEEFVIGGSKVLRSDEKDCCTIVAAGITVHEALRAYDALKRKNILVRIIDLYSIKPLDKKTLLRAAKETKHIIVVEDHYAAGGIGEAVSVALSGRATVHSLAVNLLPRSGTPEELLEYEGISARAIVDKVNSLI